MSELASILLTILVVAALVAIVATIWQRRQAEQTRPTDGTDETSPTPIPALTSTEAVVLVHGLLGFESIGIGKIRQRYFRGIREGLEHAGVPTFAASLSPMGSVPERSAQLAEFIEDLPHNAIMILAHSMGGLDARYAISKLGLHHKVRTLITIGTPHRGSALADLASSDSARPLRILAQRLGLRSDAIDWLTTERLKRFNKDVLDHPDVTYFSVVGRAAVRALWRNPLLLSSHLFLRKDGDNDGIVTVDSQRWGETLEEIDADHFAQIGWSLRFRAAALYLRLFRRATAKPLADGIVTDVAPVDQSEADRVA